MLVTAPDAVVLISRQEFLKRRAGRYSRDRKIANCPPRARDRVVDTGCMHTLTCAPVAD